MEITEFQTNLELYPVVGVWYPENVCLALRIPRTHCLHEHTGSLLLTYSRKSFER